MQRPIFKYDKYFYDEFENTSFKGANEILPEVIKRLNPRSIVDFGCGEGVWLSVAKTIDSAIQIKGLDGDYIQKEELKIPQEAFIGCDLSSKINIERADLAMSIEVAEHIDGQHSDVFIDNITRCSDNVLFSAAIPGQGGVQHVNEQWQEYWIEKFEKRGYFVDLSPRDFFWNNANITPWRKQNLLFFSKSKRCLFPEAKPVRSLAHPEMFRLKVEKINNSIYYC